MKFPRYPATIILQPRRGDEFWIGRVEMENTSAPDSPPWVMTVTGLGETRSWPVEVFDEIVPGEWEGLLWTDEDDTHVSFRVRETLPRDAEVAISLQGSGLEIPMPLELIEHIHSSDGNFTMPQLFALTDDEGFVATMLLSAPTGLYVRYSSAWHELTDDSVVENLNVYDVADTALDLFDRREIEGQLVAVTSMLAPGGNQTGERVEVTGPATEGADPAQERVVTAAGGVMVAPTLRSAEDLPEAIAAACDNPDLQWWVERRVAALGIEAELPWVA